uniref:DUF4470 domain-containing protein n=1 Tax=Schizophyllum commune (strain H4-8 / FGSC 9210) TaxID=578458 RepID=D8PPJ7_SCHCM
MAHSVILPRRTWFYPIGNTSADLLTASLPPEQNLDLLLIGCGDPRSILYTTYADGAVADKREYDVTFCDIEPAVISRNILLFTLIADTSSERDLTLWNIFYHFKISTADLTLLQRQSSKLSSVSGSLEQWQQGPYAGFLKPRTEQTLSDIRRFWEMYAATASFTKAQKQDMHDMVARGVSSAARSQKANVLTACRSAGPLWINLATSGVATAHFKHYWKHGVVGGCATDPAAVECVNPTLLYTQLGSEFCLHYGTDPIIGFHLAEALGPVKGNSTTISVRDLGAYAMREFGQWCSAFRKRIAVDCKFVLRPYVGDALSLCRALGGERNLCVSPFDSRPIVLASDNDDALAVAPPTTFNVIETSNLADHVGLLNVFTSAVPLLRPSSASVLHTNTLLRTAASDSADVFMEKIGVDITTFSTLVGLAPLSLLTRFSTSSSQFEALGAPMESKQHHQAIAWKFPGSGDQAALVDGCFTSTPVAISSKDLIQVLFKLYLNMFSSENSLKYMAMAMQGRIDEVMNSGNIVYVRASFAALLRLFKDRVRTDWRAAMEGLFDAIQDDRTLQLGMMFYQELSLHSHLLGVYSHGFFSDKLDLARMYRLRPALFTHWPRTPDIAHIVMRVPRSAFSRLDSIDADRIGTPMLQCEVGVVSGMQTNISGIQLDFGELTVTGTADKASATLVRDSDGWKGTSPVIVQIMFPARLLDIDPRSTQVRLSIRATPQSTFQLMPILGNRLVIFEADLMGKDVYVLKDAPRVLGAAVPAPRAPTVATTPDTVAHAEGLPAQTTKDVPRLIFMGNKVSHLAVKVNILSDLGKAALSKSGASLIQHTPCTVKFRVGMGDIVDTVAFPFPVDRRDVKLRMEKAAVEVIARTVDANPAIGHGGYDKIARTPVVMTQGRPSVWSLSYINLNNLPALDLARPKAQFDWMQPLMTAMFSDRELVLQRSGDKSDTFVNLKSSIAHTIIGHAAGLSNGKPSRIISLHCKSDGGVYTLLFVNALRLDLASHSVVLDVSVLPLTHAIMPLAEPVLRKLRNPGLVETPEDDVKAWKAFLPAAVERCRTWAHEADCAYHKKGIPLGLAIDESPICDCGRGKDIPNSEIMKIHKELRSLVTRAAIGPLYAVSYLEDVGKKMQAAMNAFADRTEAPEGSDKTERLKARFT